jgi:hypothetical protein
MWRSMHTTVGAEVEGAQFYLQRIQFAAAYVRADERDKKLGYFERNAHRMRYQHFRELGMFTGSAASKEE